MTETVDQSTCRVRLRGRVTIQRSGSPGAISSVPSIVVGLRPGALRQHDATGLSPRWAARWPWPCLPAAQSRADRTASRPSRPTSERASLALAFEVGHDPPRRAAPGDPGDRDRHRADGRPHLTERRRFLIFTAGLSTPSGLQLLELQPGRPELALESVPLRDDAPRSRFWKLNSEGLSPSGARSPTQPRRSFVVMVLIFNLSGPAARSRTTAAGDGRMIDNNPACEAPTDRGNYRSAHRGREDAMTTPAPDVRRPIVGAARPIPVRLSRRRRPLPQRPSWEMRDVGRLLRQRPGRPERQHADPRALDHRLHRAIRMRPSPRSCAAWTAMNDLIPRRGSPARSSWTARDIYAPGVQRSSAAPRRPRLPASEPLPDVHLRQRGVWSAAPRHVGPADPR